jgi:hypothetical protein
VCHTARRACYPDGAIKYIAAMGQDKEKPVPAGIAAARYILIGERIENAGGWATCSQMARLSVYQAAGGFDGEFRRMQDMELAIRWAKMGCHFVGVSEPLVEMEMTATSDKNADMRYKCKVRLFNKHRNIMNTSGQYQVFCRWEKVKYFFLIKKYLFFLFNLLTLFFAHPNFTILNLIRTIQNFNKRRAHIRFIRQSE